MGPQCPKMLLKLILICYLIVQISNATKTNNKCEFPAIFNFGDSNSDTGGLAAAFGQPGPPFGETFFRSPAGRFCDGRLIIDFIAQSLGHPYLSAYLDSVGSNFTYGANFATAGSSVRTPNTTLQQSGGFSPISLHIQSDEFHDFLQRSQIFLSKGGVYKYLLPKGEYFSQGLYTFDIGQNDLTAGFFANKSTDEVKAYIPDVIDQFSSVIKAIYNQGGRYFWIHNTGPFGCLPYMLELVPIKAAQIDNIGCITPLNEVAQFFNLKLKQVVAHLRKDLPHASLTYVDVYSLKYELLANASKYGFKNPLRSCCGHGGKYNYNMHIGCGTKIMVNGTQVLLGKSCKDPSVAIIWDGVHYTEAANRWIFDRIVGGSFSDPPVPLNMACHRSPDV